MEISQNALSSLCDANTTNIPGPGDRLTLSGDLCQMGAMKRALQCGGFNVGNMDVYPVVCGAEIVPALKYLFERKVDGWWGQQDSLEKYGICTSEEFTSALDWEVEKQKRLRG